MPKPLTRRRFLGTLAVSAAALSLPGCRAGAGNASPTGALPADRSRFPQSVASGDPRPDRILLWTRVASESERQTVRLQVSATAAFSAPLLERELESHREHDHCLRVRLTDLEPGQELHYRFLVQEGGHWRSSPAGRTKTAPAADADVAVRFAFMSCQDYGGRWYNTLLPLLEEPLDFILHLGDFIYETTGDPGFQSREGERLIAFDDRDGALRLGGETAPYYAARSLDNYRQLHRSVRTDPILQQLLERAPLVAIWDDHEFADDCWQANATHHDGRVDEADVERRRNAEQAYLEYMPIDTDQHPAGDEHLPREQMFPQLRIWRRLRFGRHVDLLLTDTRSERPDHLVPEDAFPGTVLYDEGELRERLPALGLEIASIEAALVPYVDLDAAEHASLRNLLQSLLVAAYGGEGLDGRTALARAEQAGRGRIALPVLAALLQRWNEQAPEALRTAVPGDDAIAGRGLAWLSLGKTQLFSSLGSRYMVLADVYNALAALRAEDGDRAPLSPRQWQWLERSLAESDASWKVVASSISLTPIVLDLSRPELEAPELLRHRFLLNVDQWDGFPLTRRALIEDLFAPAGNVVAVSGDIHAAFVSQHGPHASEFTVPAISSTTLADILANEVERDPATAESGRRLVAGLDPMIASEAPGIRHVQTGVHGLCLAQVDGAQFQVVLLTVPPQVCRQRLYETPEVFRSQLTRLGFRIDAGDGRLRPVMT